MKFSEKNGLNNKNLLNILKAEIISRAISNNQ